MTHTLPPDATLLLIDVQQGIDNVYDGERNNPDAERHIADLLGAWRAANRPIIHVRHHSVMPNSPLREGQPGTAFKPEALPRDGEPIITKNVNSAFIGTDLEDRLKTAGVETLVICGLTTQHCVSTTTRMAGNLGFTAYLAADATAANSMETYTGEIIPAEQVFKTALAELHGEFATVANTADIIAMLGEG